MKPRPGSSDEHKSNSPINERNTKQSEEIRGIFCLRAEGFIGTTFSCFPGNSSMEYRKVESFCLGRDRNVIPASCATKTLRLLWGRFVRMDWRYTEKQTTKGGRRSNDL